MEHPQNPALAQNQRIFDSDSGKKHSHEEHEWGGWTFQWNESIYPPTREDRRQNTEDRIQKIEYRRQNELCHSLVRPHLDAIELLRLGFSSDFCLLTSSVVATGHTVLFVAAFFL
jgi:hypothetical protein